jgi:Subtilase family
MRDSGMKCFFEPRRHGDGGKHDDDGSAPGLISVPEALLLRHGAVVLDPAEAAAIPGYRPPRSTVYRARTLLVPDDLMQDPAVVTAINAVLARVGMALVVPEHDRGGAGDQARGNGPGADSLRRLPRPAVLVPARPADDKTVRPVVVDAWVALQALRAAAAAQEDPVPDEEREHQALTRDVVRKIALEHLLIGSAITGSPAGGTGGGITASPNDSSGATGPSTTDSYTYGGGDTRTPVAVCLDAPKRRSASECEHAYGRGPVVAVLDTGVRAHPWLDVTADPPNGYKTAPDGFVAVDHDMQKIIYKEGEQAAASGDLQRQPIKHPWDTPITADPLVGELDTDTGHGTFIAGIVRQVAPDARVLAVKVMHSDGIVNEGDLICALRLLADRIALAEEGDLAGMVDVVSLSLGYFDESAADVAFSSGLWQVIEVLLGMGVAVVAAAGNYSTSRKFFPAGFTEEPTTAGPVPLISVGALNPNGSKALFSDGGHWITAWAAGAAVVSTFPVDINGSRGPEIRMRAHPANEMPPDVSLPAERESLDPDDYKGGFAVWSGTSFSAPLLAANIARSLLEGAADRALGLRLDVPGAQAAKDRAVAALKNLGWQG